MYSAMEAYISYSGPTVDFLNASCHPKCGFLSLNKVYSSFPVSSAVTQGFSLLGEDTVVYVEDILDAPYEKSRVKFRMLE